MRSIIWNTFGGILRDEQERRKVAESENVLAEIVLKTGMTFADIGLWSRIFHNTRCQDRLVQAG